MFTFIDETDDHAGGKQLVGGRAPLDQWDPVETYADEPVVRSVGALGEKLRRLRQNVNVRLVGIPLAVFEGPLVRPDFQFNGRGDGHASVSPYFRRRVKWLKRALS